MVSQTIIFVFSILKIVLLKKKKNLFLEVGTKYVKYKNYYLKTNFKFNFLKIVFILF